MSLLPIAYCYCFKGTGGWGREALPLENENRKRKQREQREPSREPRAGESAPQTVGPQRTARCAHDALCWLPAAGTGTDSQLSTMHYRRTGRTATQLVLVHGSIRPAALKLNTQRERDPDRERGRQRHNATAIQRRRHLVGPLPDRYVTARDAARRRRRPRVLACCVMPSRGPTLRSCSFRPSALPSASPLPSASAHVPFSITANAWHYSPLVWSLNGGRTWPPPEPPP